VAVSIFDPSSVFVTLSTTPFGETAPLARALQSTIVEQAGFNVLNQVQDRTFAGFSADTPGIQARPIQLAVDNLLLLGSLTAQFEQRLTQTQNNLIQLQETLQSAIRNENTNLLNRADDVLESSLLAQFIAAADQTGLLEDTADDPVAVPKFLDFNFRKSESQVFGTELSAQPFNFNTTTNFVRGVSLAAGESITLDKLVIGTAGNANFYRFLIESEAGTSAVASVSGPFDAQGFIDVSAGSGNTLADFSLTAGSGGFGAQDFLYIIPINEVDEDTAAIDPTTDRGSFQAISVTSTAASTERPFGDSGEEQIRDYTFYTTSGGAYSQFRLNIEGLAALGFTDALTAIENGDLVIRAGETLIDGSINSGQVDRRNSSGDTIILVFPFQSLEDGFDQNGVNVEVRSTNATLDLNSVTVTATFP